MKLNKNKIIYTISIILINLCFITSVKAEDSFLDILSPFIKPKESIEKQSPDNTQNNAPQKEEKKYNIDDEIEEILNSPKTKFSNADNILDILPHEVDLLVRIDFQKFLSQTNSKHLIKRWLKKNSYLLSDYKEIKAKSGFDFFRDINKIYLFAAYKIDRLKGIQNGILIEGKFEKEKFLKFAKESAYITSDHYFNKINGYDVLCPRYGKNGYAILVDDRYLVIGSEYGVNSLKDCITGRYFGSNNHCLRKVLEEQDKDLENTAFLKIAAVPPQSYKDKLKILPNMNFIQDVEYFYSDFGYYYLNFDEDFFYEAIKTNYYIKIYDDKDTNNANSCIVGLISNYENYLKKELPLESYNALTQSKHGGFRWDYYIPANEKKLHFTLTLSFEEIEKIYTGWRIRGFQLRENGY